MNWEVFSDPATLALYGEGLLTTLSLLLSSLAVGAVLALLLALALTGSVAPLRWLAPVLSFTAEEIWAQMEGRIDGFTCAVGTGGTLAGVAASADD